MHDTLARRKTSKNKKEIDLQKADTKNLQTNLIQQISSVALTNLVSNGNFASDTTGWTFSGCAGNANNGFVGTVSASPAKVIQVTTKSPVSPHVLYISGEATVNGPNCTKITLYLWNDAFAGTTKLYYVNNPVQGTTYKLGGYFTIPSTWNAGKIRVSMQYDFSNSGAGVEIRTNNMMCIDLTDAFGADNEYRYNLDALLAQYPNKYFSDTVNTPTIPVVNVFKKETTIDPTHLQWSDDIFSKGFLPAITNVLNKHFGSVYIEGVYMAHCSPLSRWNKANYNNGGHVFEGFAKDRTHRITLLVVNNSNEDNLYRSAIQDFDIINGTYGWLMVGSDGDNQAWEFHKDMARANVPLYMRPGALPTKMPGKDASGNDIPIKDGVLAFDGTGLKFRIGGVWKTVTLS
ncbi:hypothetical protein [Pseudobacteroides cellulosolvens]|uniref:Uncharacterized protein n=1 Tax=Pseudobacteroides cellulosolvens ATCC 35603 = DSM 2933 TaxID=398512 RepID=A0A0L6JGL9_9FIRM|nr:hypothetical protein [Pseudobacteroides cellulosolvens]KNY24840.1 hypothetical protein Bccel_0097 [Pseudobacteroides cellulosolvens ATCC 35603 = DSM 2933]